MQVFRAVLCESQREKQKVVAEVASQLFGIEVKSSNVIQEVLNRITDKKHDLSSAKNQLTSTKVGFRLMSKVIV